MEVDTSIYLLRTDNAYKIGISSNVAHRLSNIRTSTPGKVDLVFESIKLERNRALAIETGLHNAFKHKNVSGEWFALSNTDMGVIIAYLSQLEVSREEQEEQTEPEYQIDITATNRVLSSLPLVVVDTDNRKALEYANKRGLCSTLTEETPRGYHLYYKIPKHVLNYRSHTYKNGLELKCFSCPSQIDGVKYEVINDTAIAFAPLWIINAITVPGKHGVYKLLAHS